MGPGAMGLLLLTGAGVEPFGDWAPFVDDRVLRVIKASGAWTLLAAVLVLANAYLGDRLLPFRREGVSLDKLLHQSPEVSVLLYANCVTVVYPDKRGRKQLLVVTRKDRFIELLDDLERRNPARVVELASAFVTPFDAYGRYCAKALASRAKTLRLPGLMAAIVHVGAVPLLVSLPLGMTVWRGTVSTQSCSYAFAFMALTFLFVFVLRVHDLWWRFFKGQQGVLNGDKERASIGTPLQAETGGATAQRTHPFWPAMQILARARAQESACEHSSSPEGA